MSKTKNRYQVSIHEKPQEIKAGKSEDSDEGKEKLTDFRHLIEKRLCKYWNNPSDLGAKVSRSITQLIKHNPAVGWVKADQADMADNKEIIRLHREIESLQQKILELEPEAAEDLADLSQGEDEIEVNFGYEAKKPKTGKNGNTYWVKGEEHDDSIILTWNDIFRFISPYIIDQLNEYQLIGHINNLLHTRALAHLEEKHEGCKIESIRIFRSDWQTIKVQLRALGLIENGENLDCWVLTSLGDRQMTKLIAKRRTHN